MIELFFEFVEAAEGFVDGLREVADGGALFCGGVEDFPEERVVVVAAAIVADGGADFLGDDGQVVGEDFVERLAVKIGCAFADGFVEIGDVGVVMLAVMDFHRHFVDVGLERIGWKGQRGKSVGHNFSLSFLVPFLR